MVSAGPSAASLARLQRSHLLHVPFENLDIHLGVRIELDQQAFIEKIVGRGRGGFCYELNSSFAALLASLGYAVSLLEARVFADGRPGIAFDHLCLVVELERRYLVDVGFGDSFVEPLPLVLDEDLQDPAGTFRISDAVDGWYDLHRDDTPDYRFSTNPRRLDDFASGSHHHQTSQETSFTRRPVCTRLTDDGRVTLRGSTLTTTCDGERTDRSIEADQLAATLAAAFGITIEPDEVGRLSAASSAGSTLFETALGVCGVGWNENRVVAVALPETDDATTLRRVSSDASQAEERQQPPIFVQRGIDAMVELIDGRRRSLGDVLIDLGDVPPFDADAYAVARTIEPGEVLTYGAIAKRLGQPGGAQAVGGAMGRNPIPIIVPCHRVIAADGELGGFSANGGTATKRTLLEIEGAPIDRQLF